MFYGAPGYLRISAELLAVIATGLACFIILRKIIEGLSIAKNRRRIENIDSALADFINSSPGDSMPKALLNTRLDELAYILDQAKNHPDAYKKELLYKTVLSSGKVRKLQEIAVSSVSRSRRILAIKILGKLGSDEGTNVIRNIIGASIDPDIIYAGIQALGEIDSDASVASLISLLGASKFSNSKIAAILETLRRSFLNNSLKRKDDVNSVVRFWVANLLGNYKNEAAIKPLEAMLKDKDPNVRAAACESLGRIGNKESITSIHAMLGDDCWFVRLHAIKTLGEFLSPESIDKIIPSLRHENWWVRYNAKSTLKKFAQAVTPYLCPLLRDDDRFARNSAVEILEETGSADALFNTIITDNVSDEKTFSYFMDFIKAEGFLWLKSRLKNMNSEKRLTLLKRIESQDKLIYAKMMEDEFIIGKQ